MTRGGHAYMAKPYRDAQTSMRSLVRQQWDHPPLTGPIGLYLKLYGEGRGDSDNLAGFILDAAGPSKGVPGILWEDDRVSVIPLLIVDWEKSTKADSRWLVHILRLDA